MNDERLAHTTALETISLFVVAIFMFVKILLDERGEINTHNVIITR